LSDETREIWCEAQSGAGHDAGVPKEGTVRRFRGELKGFARREWFYSSVRFTDMSAKSLICETRASVGCRGSAPTDVGFRCARAQRKDDQDSSDLRQRFHHN